MIARTNDPLGESPARDRTDRLGHVLATPVFLVPAHVCAEPTGTPSDPYMNPDDGMCVVGVAPDGTMRVDWLITNARALRCVYDRALGTCGVDITTSTPCGALGTGLCNTSATLHSTATEAVVLNPLKCFDVSAPA